MKRTKTVCVLLVILFTFISQTALAQKEPFKGLDAYVQKAMKEWEVPGLALAGTMDHWQYDSFEVHWRDKEEGTGMVTFTLNADGKVDLLKW